MCLGSLSANINAERLPNFNGIVSYLNETPMLAI